MIVRSTTRLLRTRAARSQRAFSTAVEQANQGHAGHGGSRTTYFALLALAAVGCGALSLLKYTYKDKNYVDISGNLKKRMYDDRASKNYPVHAWPNIEHALAVLYGFEIISYLSLTLNSLKFARKSIDSAAPSELRNAADALEVRIKMALSKILPQLSEKTNLSEGAQLAVGALLNAVQGEGGIDWDAIESKFSDVDWVNEKPHTPVLEIKARENALMGMKSLSFEANLLERGTERYLMGKTVNPM